MSDIDKGEASLSREEMLALLAQQSSDEIDYYDLSYAQERLWFLDQLESGSPTYNMPAAVKITGVLNITALEQALLEIIQRHEVLRSQFVNQQGQPKVWIREIDEFNLEWIDLSTQSSLSTLMTEYARKEANKAFDLEKDLLLRACLLKCADDQHVLLLTMHHIISDGWSVGIFIREVNQLYEAFSLGKDSPLAALEIQYLDFAEWQRDYLADGVMEQQLQYWRQQLADVPVLNLATDYPRPSMPTTNGCQYHFQIDTDLTDKLSQLAREQGTTLYMVLLAVFYLLLSRYTRQSDMTIGTPIAGRSQEQTEPLIGFFVNTLVMRANVLPESNFIEFLEQVKKTALSAYANQDLPFAKLVEELAPERDLSIPPLFQVMFILQNTPKSQPNLAGVEIEFFDLDYHMAKFDITLDLNETEQGIQGAWVYNTDLFTEASIAGFAKHYQTLLYSVVKQFEQPLYQLSIVSEQDYQKVVFDWNHTKQPYPKALSIHQVFEQQAEQTPDNIAVVYQDQSINFRDLNRWSNQLAFYLRDQGVVAENRVGLCLRRSVDMIVAIFGILKAGAAYVPIDPSYPKERIDYMLKDSSVALVMTQSDIVASLAPLEIQTFLMDKETAVLARYSQDNPAMTLAANPLAYVIYTSGSTGQPKGVEVEHQNVLHLSFALQQAIYHEYSEHLNIGLLAPIAFDASVKQWQLLLSGHCLHIIPETHRKDPSLLLNYFAKHQINGFDCTPSLLRLLLDCPNPDVPSLATDFALVGGEPIRYDLWQDLIRHSTTFYNVYGPTETTVNASVAKITEAQPLPNIGRALANTRLYVLDERQQVVPIGFVGELYIAGDGVARGYLNRAALTAEKFLANAELKEERLYRTGDFVRFLPQGELQFMGRVDDQVKLRGYRIELGEIASQIQQEDRVEQAVVIVREDQIGDQRLVAYLVGSIDEDEIARLRQQLPQVLPEFMLPSAYVILEAIPLNVHGKLDKSALPKPNYASLNIEGIYEAPRNPHEEVIASIWSDILAIDAPSIHDNFFALGGHSLLATQVVSRIQQVLKIEIPLRWLFEYPNIAELSVQIEQALAEQQGLLAPPIVPVSRQQRLPLSFAQERLWFLDQLEPESPFYNIPAMVRLRGHVDFKALTHALQSVVDRHESLRTVFRVHQGQAYQKVLDQMTINVQQVDLLNLDDAAREQQALTVARAEVMKPFSLFTGPLLRACLIHIGKRHFIFAFSLHHIIADGWSIEILIQELLGFYQSALQQQALELAELPIQYPDFAVWQRQWLQGEVLDKQLNYWQEQLKDCPTVLDLPLDFPRPKVQSFNGCTWSFSVDPSVLQALQRFSQQHNVTLNMTLMAVYMLLLYRYSGQTDICIGTPTANRNRIAIEGLIGFFVNTLVMRQSFDPNVSFNTWIQQIREMALQAYAHQDVPFEKVVEAVQVERSLQHSPVFQVMFALQEGHQFDWHGEGDLRMTPLFGDMGIAKFDLSLFLEQTSEGLLGRLEYNRDLFLADTIMRMMAHFQRLLDLVVAEPETALSKFALLSETECKQILVEWNQTQTAYPKHLSIVDRFEQQVAIFADHPALLFGQQSLNYQQCNILANQLAHRFVELGVESGDIVAICLPRGINLIIGLLAILKAGGVYLPLDASYPTERLLLMLEDSQAKLLMTIPNFLELDSDVNQIYYSPEQLQDYPSHNLGIQSKPQDLAYIIYTSGSTGRPKGVCVPHQGVLRLVVDTNYVAFACQDRVAHFSNVSFDAATFEIWGALLNGGCLIGFDLDTVLHPEKFTQLIRLQGVSTIFVTTALFNQLVREVPDVFQSLTTVCFGGEACDPNRVRDVLNTAPPKHLLHVYGPTENTTYSTYYEVKSVAENAVTVPIGKPLANSTCYVLNNLLDPVPIGVIGELYVGGDGLAHGYLNRPDLTDEKFIVHDFGDDNVQRLYKTGDLVRYNAQGDIEFIARIDHQVKIRGFRIELGEIQAKIKQYSQIKEAFIRVWQDDLGNKQLLAYLVLKSQGFERKQLKSYLKEYLPDYMIPAHFIVIDALPLNPNGKVDQNALPLPEYRQTQDFIAPSNYQQEILASIWGKLLQQDQISIDANFFELGGHSLLATQVISQIRQAFQVEVSLKQLFDQPTIEGLAKQIEQLQQQVFDLKMPKMDGFETQEYYPLSFSQERLWFLHQFETDRSAYHIPIVVSLSGELDLVAFEQAFGEIIRRHQSLRTRFVVVDGQAKQQLLADYVFQLDYEQVLNVSEQEQQQVIASEFERQVKTPFDLSQLGFRSKLMAFSGYEHVFFLTFHHIIADGWSLGVLLKELAGLYEAFSQGLPSPFSPLSVQYPHFALWQRKWLQGKIKDIQLKYWRKHLEGLGNLDLPTDYPRPSQQTFNGAEIGFQLSDELSHDLTVFSRQQGVTLFMTLLAGFQVLLSRYSHQTDIAVGSPVAGRNRAEIEPLIGLFINTLVFRTDVSGEPSFAKVLQQVRETTLGGYSHQDLPFEMLIEDLQPTRDASRSPLFQVMFILQNMPLPELGLAGLHLTPMRLPTHTAKFDLTLTMTPSDPIGASIEYNTDLFKATTIQRFIEHWQNLLTAVVADPDIKISDIEFLTATEKQLLLVDWNQTQRDYPQQDFSTLFAQQVAKTPDQTALIFEGQQYSYQQLQESVNQLARYLEQYVISSSNPKRLIAVYMERSAEMVLSVLALLKLGVAYLPLDPFYPEERVNYMLEDSTCIGVITHEHLTKGLATADINIWIWENIKQELGKQSPQDIPMKVSPDNLAYMIYTSGSTGKPKGVPIQHRSLVNFLYGMQQHLQLSTKDKLLAVTSLSFDIHTLELFLPLLVGATVVVAKRETAMDGESLKQLLEQQHINIMQATPATWKLLLQSQWQATVDFKVCCGGEAMPIPLAKQFVADAKVELWNFYGPTETTVWSTVHQVSEVGHETVAIGRPIANTQIYILDQALQLVPIGRIGELYIGGDGLSPGYFQRESLSKERFIASPFRVGERIYRTGDLARYQSDGVIECLGRIDHQVKIRGYRIELGEIEALLAEHSAIQEAVVSHWQIDEDDKLVAYLMLFDDMSIADEAEIRDYLQAFLPAYMIPSAFVIMETWPLTPNGKIDRKALPKPQLNDGIVAEYLPPRTLTEQTLSEQWREILNREQISIDANFFEMGGHSLLATQVMSKIRQQFGVELSLKTLFESATIAELAKVIEQPVSSEKTVMTAITPAKRDQAIPLSFAQERLWFIEQLEPEQSMYNLPMAIKLYGQLDVDAMQQSFDLLVERHEVLRTLFVVNNGQPQQQILPHLSIKIDWIDLSQVPQGRQQPQAEQLALNEFQQAFDLSKGPLLRCRLLHLHQGEHILLLTMHHIISDGWSIGLLVQELAMIYQAYRQGQESQLKPLAIQYADFAIWQRQWLQGAVLQEQLDYWKQQLAGAPPYLSLPTDRPRPEVQTYTGQHYRFRISKALSQQLKDFARHQGCTLFMVLLAAYQFLLSRYAKQDDICVGIPIAGRNRSEVEPLIGFFVNGLIMRTKLSGNLSIAELLQRVKQTTLSAYAHQDLPFEVLVEELQPERNLSYPPIAQVGFALQNTPMGALDLADLRFQPMEIESKVAKYDFGLVFAEDDDGLQGVVEYNTDLFKALSIARMVSHYQKVLNDFVSVAVERCLVCLSLVTEEELYQALNLSPETVEAIYPLTVTQRDMYLESIVNPDGLSNSVGYAIELDDEVDLNLWQQACHQVYQAQPVLRTEIVSSNLCYLDMAYQCVYRDYPTPLKQLDWRDYDASEADIRERVRQLIHRPWSFDGALTQHYIVHLYDGRRLNVGAGHHILLDAFGGTLEIEQVCRVYESLVNHTRFQHAPAVFHRYIDYNLQHFDRADIIDFWKQKAITIEALDYPVSDSRHGEFQTKTLKIDLEHWQHIKQWTRKQRITPAIYFRALYGILLKLYCRAEQDFMVHEVNAGRFKEYNRALGTFFQEIPLVFHKQDLEANVRISDYFATVKNYFRELGENKNISALLKNQIIPQGRMSFYFNYFHFNAEIVFLEKTLPIWQYLLSIPPQQVQLVVNAGAEQPELVLNYHSAFFEEFHFIERLIYISRQIIGGVETLANLEFILPEETKKLLTEIYQHSHEQLFRPITYYFEKQALKTPDAIAVEAKGLGLNYHQLNLRANQFAHYLHEKGVSANHWVGVCMSRQPELMVVILGILKAGAGYLPLDPSYPKERLHYILKDSRAHLLVADNEQSWQEVEVLNPQYLIALTQDYPESNLSHIIKANDLAYMIYTSGSTGKPKGVEIEQGGMMNLLHWYVKEFDMTCQDKTLIVSAIGFDLTQKNLFALLMVGGTIVFPSNQDYEADAIIQDIKNYHITLLNCAPSMFYPLVADATKFDDIASLNYVFLGGEPIVAGHLLAFYQSHAMDCQIVNTYGPTECTDIASFYRIETLEQLQQPVIPIGQANHNVQLYVLDEQQRLLPPGVVGELYIGGLGVSRGYWRDSDKTRQKFIEPELTRPQTIYRTGDLVRYRADGLLVFIGRVDHQVKLRGLRIELGEIEALLKQQAVIDDALVLVKDEQLVAYVIANNDLDTSDIRSHLSDYLPNYMMPSYFYVLEQWPLTPNGKIDRHALPESDRFEHAYIAPESEIEKRLAEWWQQLLGVDKVGKKDDFFALGGHSLLATQLLSQIRTTFEVELPLRVLFEVNTLEDLATAIEAEQQQTTPSLPPLVKVSRQHHLPLSFAQQRLWFLQQMEPNNTGYNIPLAVTVKGVIHLQALQRSIRALIRRHEILRTVFAKVKGQPVQVIDDSDKFELAVTDLQGFTASEQQQAIRDWQQKLANHCFDLSQLPLFTLQLLKLAPEEAVLLFSIHHIISDGWSSGVMMRDLLALYQAHKRTEKPQLMVLPIQYADFAVWQRALLVEDYRQQLLDWWQQELLDIPEVLTLPTDRPRPTMQTFVGKLYPMTLSPELSAQLEAFAKKQQVTLFMLLMAVYQVLLYRYTSEQHICVGSPIAGRDQSELENLIGCFVNTLVIHGDCAENPSFMDFLAQIKTKMIGAFAHSQLPFEQLVEVMQPVRNMSHSPLFQVAFAWQTSQLDAIRSDELEFIPLTMDHHTAKFDLTLILLQQQGQITGALEYNTDLFDTTTIARWTEHFQQLLQSVMAQPQLSIAHYQFLSAQEQQTLLYDWNQTQVPLDFVSIVSKVQYFAEHTPNALAIAQSNFKVSYQQLEQWSNYLAHKLAEQGVVQGDFVGVYLTRSWQQVLSLLAVLKLGAAYIPIDPLYPKERVEFMIADAKLRLLITQTELVRQLQLEEQQYWVLAEDWQFHAVAHTAIDNIVIDAKDTAYMIYTSGSTGQPKGVPITHGSLANLLAWHQRSYEVRPKDRATHLAGLAFDASVWEIWPYLTAGASLWLVEEEWRSQPERLQQWLLEQQISISFMATPLAERMLLLDWPETSHLRYLLTGGDQLHHYPEPHLPFKLVNHYGPTECTVLVSATTVPTQDQLVGDLNTAPDIGRPIDNTQLYIFDKQQQLVPIGVAGELCVAGVSLSQGYWQRDALTAEKFIANPLAESGRLYRTGDLVRYRADGHIEYLGRIDQQVKIRGFRIELGEIEALLGQLSQIVESVVVVQQQAQLKQLVAYVVFHVGQTLSVAELRQHLLQHLPDYMVPTQFVFLPELPLTPNGKVDRKALPKADLSERSHYIAPRNEFEEQLAELWYDLLGVELVGVQDDFFSLGGHSLLATQLVAHIQDKFKVELPLRMLFESPTIETIAQYLQQQQPSKLPEIIAETDREAVFPLSFAQERLWFLQQLQAESSAYHVPTAIHLIGYLDQVALQLTVCQLIRRHESLRTAFPVIDDQVQQVILKSGECGIQYYPASEFDCGHILKSGHNLLVVNLSHIEEADKEAKAQQFVQTIVQQPFDLESGRLFRVVLLKLSKDQHILVMVMHHIITDGWSVGLLMQEFVELYQASVQGFPHHLADLPIQYADYARWQRQYFTEERLQQQIDYWKIQLSQLSALELATDHPRPPIQSLKGAKYCFQLSAKLQGELYDLCQQQGVTLYMLLLGAFQILLALYSGQQDIAVGSPVAGRRHASVEKVVGFFINTLVMRNNVQGGPKFTDFIQNVKETALSAYAHQDVPFEKLVEVLAPERDMSRSPLFQVMFALQNQTMPSLESGGLSMKSLETTNPVAKFDLNVSLMETDQGLIGEWEYNTDLFERNTIASMVQHFQRLLQSIVATPEQAIHRLDYLSDAEQQTLLYDWNDTYVEIQGSLSIPSWFERQVEQNTEAIAVICGHRRLNYQELNQQANQLAYYLCENGVVANCPVALCVAPSVDVLVAILAILKAGGAYLPIDPSYPKERIAYILKDAKVPVLLTQSEIVLPEHSAQTFYLDQDYPKCQAYSWKNPNLNIKANDLAYVIYTSGSTGKPKGTGILHQGVVNLLQWFGREFAINEQDRSLIISSLGFDLTQKNLLAPLLRGGGVVFPEQVGYHPEHMVGQIEQYQISLLNCAPSAFYPLVADSESLSKLKSLRCLFLGGEPIALQKMQSWLEHPDFACEIVNTYGPTECTDIASFYRMIEPSEYHDKFIPIGKPNDNVQCFILSQDLQLLPIGVVGELCISGMGVGIGYLNNDDETKEKFVAHPLLPNADSKLYRTGDFARYFADGNIEYMGRMDFQVKLRGLRIELGEIEYALRQQSVVEDVIVIVENERIVAYVVLSEPAFDTSLFKPALRDYLPEYMLPSLFMVLDALPLSPNGKVDRKALPKPDYSLVETPYVAPETPTEKILVDIWQSVLQQDKIGTQDNFFDLGGHSLLATQVISQVKKQFQVNVPLQKIFEDPSIATLARLIDQQQPMTETDDVITKLSREEDDDTDADSDIVADVEDIDELDEEDLDALLAELSDEELAELDVLGEGGGDEDDLDDDE